MAYPGVSVSNNRRQHYRVATSTDHEVSVQLVLPDGTGQVVALIDISAGGVALALPAEEGRDIKINAAVIVAFESDRNIKPLEIASHIQHIKMSDDGLSIIYGVSFDPWDEGRLRLTPKLLSLFNEREAVRVDPRDDEEIDVQLIFSGRGRVVEGVLRDISVSGMGVWLEVDDEPSLRSAPMVKIEMNWPSGADPLHLEVEVRHIASIGTRSRVGMRFFGEDCAQNAARQKSITNYVMTRQIENARIDAERRRAMESHYPTR